MHAVLAGVDVGLAGCGVDADDPGGSAAADVEELAAEAYGGAGASDGAARFLGVVYSRGDYHSGELSVRERGVACSAQSFYVFAGAGRGASKKLVEG